MTPFCLRSRSQAVFSGHNHGNDWCCPYKSLWMCYAHHSGHGGYRNGWPLGAKVVEFDENPFRVNTWVRLEEGVQQMHGVLRDL